MGAFRALGLGTVTAVVATALGVVTPPVAHAVDPVFPDPASASWLPVTKSSQPITDASGEVEATYLDLVPPGGSFGNGVASVHADLKHVYFRVHVAATPTGAGAYILQFDTNNDVTGWERALRYDPTAGTVTVLSTDPNSGVTAKGTVVSTLALDAASRTSYASPGGAFVAFALPRGALANAGINLGAAMVIGSTSETLEASGAALNGSALLILKAKADILGVGKSNPAWQNAASDLLDIDSDGDTVADRSDNCPIVPNPGQEDDDAAVDNSIHPDPALNIPDGTEGRGNACDPTPRGYDSDEDNVGLMDDDCPEQYGLLSNGCVAQSTTIAVLRYSAKRKAFMGVVRADYDQCVPRRSVTVLRSVSGPDRNLGSVRTDSDGKYVLDKRARKGKYYAKVDPKWTLGARCFAVKSPKIAVR